MSEELLGDLRSAFGSFEKSLGTREAIGHLREAIDLYLDILDDENCSEENKKKAKNLGETYWMNFAENVADIVDKPGTYDFATSMLWLELATAFNNADIGEKESNKEIALALICSVYMTLAPDEKRQFLRQDLAKLKTQK